MKEPIEMQNEAHEAYLAELADSQRYRNITTFLSAIYVALIAIFLVVYIYRG